MRLYGLFVVFGLTIVMAHESEAKTCPSMLQGQLHTFNRLSLGAELRFSSYYVNQYDYEEETRRDETLNLWSLRGQAEYTFSDTVFAGFEGIVRNKVESAEDFECDHADSEYQMNIRQLWLEYAPERFTLHVGRDVLASGNQLVLDNYVDYASLEKDFGSFTMRMGGGVLARDVAREALSCQREIVYEYHQCWKQFCTSDWGDQRLGFVETRFSLFAGHYQQFLLLYTNSAVEEQNSVIGDIFLNGKLSNALKYFIECAVQKYQADDTLYPGAALMLAWNFSLGRTSQYVQAGLLVAQREEERRFAPLFESLWIGERAHFSIYQGDIWYLRHTVNLKTFPQIKLVTQYAQKFSDALRDELDVGPQLLFKDKYQVWLTYSALNLAGEYHLTQQLQIQVRLIL